MINDTVPTPAPTPAAPAQTTAQIQYALQPLANDAVQAEKEIVAIVAAYKSKGAQGVAALLPALAPELTKSYADVKAALPIITAGYKTSEFWIVAVVILGLTVMTAMGKTSALDSTTIIGALTGIYTVVRGVLKKN